jgi:hypothetical protein
VNAQASDRLTHCVICRASGKPDVPAVEDGYCEAHLRELNEAAGVVSQARSQPPQDSAREAGSSPPIALRDEEVKQRRAKKEISSSHKDSNTEDSNSPGSSEDEMATVELQLAYYEAGKFEPERIELRPLPDDASGAMRAVYELWTRP